MYSAYLILPDGKGPFDLDRTVTGLLNEIGYNNKIERTIGTHVAELYEVPNIGVIDYAHSATGNDISTFINFFDNGRVQRTKKMLTAGCLLLLGFDESTPFFLELVSKVNKTLDDYLFKQV